MTEQLPLLNARDGFVGNAGQTSTVIEIPSNDV
jgi:hypothetical protein